MSWTHRLLGPNGSVPPLMMLRNSSVEITSDFDTAQALRVPEHTEQYSSFRGPRCTQPPNEGAPLLIANTIGSRAQALVAQLAPPMCTMGSRSAGGCAVNDSINQNTAA